MKKTILTFLQIMALTSAIGQVSIVLQEAASSVPDPVDLAHAGDARLFVVQQTGIISILDADMNLLPTPFLDIESKVNDSGNEMGLLGLTFHPDYSNNGNFYVNYTAGPNTNRITRISRYTVSGDPDVADPNSEFVIMEASQPYSNHNGGDLEFGPDGYLYIAYGDGGAANDPDHRAQNMLEPMGKMFRIDVDGGSPYAIPADNPFANAVDTLQEIWASGLRNPWRFGFDALTGDLWLGDVGQNAREEVDFWPGGDNSGPNFGWRCREAFITGVSGGGCLGASAYVEPVADQITSFSNWCSVIGGRVYRGNAFPELYGHYLFTDYCKGNWISLVSDSIGGFIETQVASSSVSGLAAIAENNIGELFTCNEQNDKVYRICLDEPPVIMIDVNGMITSTQAVSYTWYRDGNLLPDTTASIDPMNVGGTYHVVADIGAGCIFQSNSVFVSGIGIDEAERAKGMIVYPNPADDSIVVNLADRFDLNELNAVILDNNGSIMKEMTPSKRNFRMATRDLANGQYHLAIKVGNRIESMKSFVVAH